MDQIDCDILRTLQSNARATFRELSDRVGLSANAVAERIRKLEEHGVIRGYRADIDPAAFDLTIRAFIEVKMESTTPASVFEARAAATEGIIRAVVTTGRYDWVLEVIARDQLDLQRIIEELRADGLTRDTYSRIIARDRTFPLFS